MARSDLLIQLIKYGLNSDKLRFRNVVESIIAEERAKKHTVLAERLDNLLRQSNQNQSFTNGPLTVDQRIENLFQEVIPQRNINELILSDEIRQIIQDLVKEHHRRDLLRSYNLEPRNRILLVGPPGNGKTSLAEAIAELLTIPLFIVRYDSVVGRYLGETANRLRKLIDFASTRQCVLFFDEFETLGKERGDLYETGEIKRVVSSLLMQIDALPSHVVVIGATNHPELLDRASWRRFQIRIELTKPSQERLEEWFIAFFKKMEIDSKINTSELSKKLHGISFAEAEEFGLSVIRQYVLKQPNMNIEKIVLQTIKQWPIRSIHSDTKKRGGK